jgi:hypothetical protein
MVLRGHPDFLEHDVHTAKISSKIPMRPTPPMVLHAHIGRSILGMPPLVLVPEVPEESDFPEPAPTAQLPTPCPLDVPSSDAIILRTGSPTER